MKTCLLTLTLALAVPATTLAQAWEIEVHGGGAFVNNLTGDTGSLPARGAAFTTPSRLPSRRVSSWYFGDGAVLLNGVLSTMGRPVRITALDSVLTGGFAERGNGGGLGFRVGREITRRFGAEFNLDFTTAPVELTSSSVAGIEATNDSFVPAFLDLLGTAGRVFTNAASGSEFEIQHGDGRQMAATGALKINLVTQGRVIPYTTVGAGVIVNRGDSPSAELNGTYSFRVLGVAPIDERDSLRVTQAIDENVFVGVFGGGVNALLTRRSGIRFDVRAHVGNHSVATLLSASPSRVPASVATSVAIWTATNPSVQFSNADTIFGVQTPTTLSGPAINGFETRRVDGLFRQVLVTVGYFWRF